MGSQFRKWTSSEPFTLHYHRRETCHVFRWLQTVAYVSKCCWYADGIEINCRCSATDVLIIYTQVELESGGCSDMRYPSGTHFIFTFGEISFAHNVILNCLIVFKLYKQNDIDVAIYSVILQNNSNRCYGRTSFLDNNKHALGVDIATALSNKHKVKWFAFLKLNRPHEKTFWLILLVCIQNTFHRSISLPNKNYKCCTTILSDWSRQKEGCASKAKDMFHL